MMKIYEAGTKDFLNNGLGMIQPLKCIEEKRKSLNGWSIDCEVELKYSDIIQKDNVVVVDTKEKGPQPFLINAPDISNTITFTADHIIFSSERYLLDDVRPTNLIGFEFLEWINERTDTKSPFSVYSNIPSRRTKYFIRKNMLEALEETEEIFNGVYDVDNFNISLLTTVGNMSDVSLIYGKNIEGMKKWENWDTVCTKILPVGPDELMIPEKYIESDISYSTPYTRTVTFDIEKEKEDGTQKTEDEMIIELRELAINHLENNKYPRVNYTVTANVPQNLHIGDIVPVKHPIATFETDVQAYKYDHITKRVISIEYGNYERNVKKAFQSIKSEIKEVSKKSDNFLTQAKDEIYYLMNVAGKNGSIVFRKNEDGVIYEILAMDTKDIETAKTIMRLNAQGIAGTDKGINGQFNVGMMANGSVVADMIKTGTLRAINIEGVTVIASTFRGGSININSNFVVDSDGNMTVNGNGKFIGEVSGSTINGSNIVGSALSSQSGTLLVSISNGKLTFINSKNNTLIDAYAADVVITQGDDITGKGDLVFDSSITSKAQIQSAGNLYSNKNAQIAKICYAQKFQNISDIRKKENVESIDLTGIFDYVVIKKFNYINDIEKSVGVIAQDFIGTPYEDVILRKDTEGYYTVDYTVFALACIQRQAQLEKQFDDLVAVLKSKGVI